MPVRLYQCFILLISFLGLIPLSQARIKVTDDGGRTISIEKPARRIISLAPHTTELLFAAGAGKHVVAVTEYSNYPEAAKSIPTIGNIFTLDIERLLAIKPDLIVIWGTGNAKALANRLRNQKFVVYESEPRNLEMIASSIERLSILAGSSEIGHNSAHQLRSKWESLKTQYQAFGQTKPVRVFYQMIKKPLMTINDEHIISSAIKLCGGQNVFAQLKEVSTAITQESVLTANPDMMVGAGDHIEQFDSWKNFNVLHSVKNQHFFVVPSDLIHRAGPRFIDGAEQLCKHIHSVRQKIYGS